MKVFLRALFLTKHTKIEIIIKLKEGESKYMRVREFYVCTSSACATFACKRVLRVR